MVGLTVASSADLVRAMGTLSVELRRDAVAGAVLAGAVPIQSRMGQLAPRSSDAPHLAEHIGVRRVTKLEGVAIGEGAAAVAIGPTSPYFYGWMQEFGWVFHPAPRPFARPAFEETKHEAQAIIGAHLWRTVSGGA